MICLANIPGTFVMVNLYCTCRIICMSIMSLNKKTHMGTQSSLVIKPIIHVIEN